MSIVSWPKLLEKLLQANELSAIEAKALMNAWLNDELLPVQTGAFLAVLRTKGMTGEELAAMARILQSASSVPCPIPELHLVDTCGTGGDGANTFNILLRLLLSQRL